KKSGYANGFLLDAKFTLVEILFDDAKSKRFLLVNKTVSAKPTRIFLGIKKHPCSKTE
ncbi:MAG: hypothetical protein ACJAXI_000114, partial [Crocinitomicaceae bacterium]